MSHVPERHALTRVVVSLFAKLVLWPVVAWMLTSCGERPAAIPPVVGDSHGLVVVDEIVDGDTIVVRFASGGTERVRLLGVDTPETSDPTRPVQCFGAEATSHLTALIAPEVEVRLERDIEARDQYGRLLAYVFRSSDDLFVNEALVRGGFADISFYEPNTAYRDVLTHAVTEARTSQSGLWSRCGGADVAIDPAN